MKRVEQTMFLQSSRPLLARSQEVLELCLVSLNPINCHGHFSGVMGSGRKSRGGTPWALAGDAEAMPNLPEGLSH